MTKILYPSWRYHATDRAQIVQNQADADALGAGWADTPGGPVAPEPPPEPTAADAVVARKKPGHKPTL